MKKPNISEAAQLLGRILTTKRITVKQIATGEIKQVPASDFKYGTETHRALIEGGWLIVEERYPVYGRKGELLQVTVPE